MRTFSCSCGETLFFDNTRCESCGSEAGFCPVCHLLVALRGTAADGYRCGNPHCGTALAKCHNYQVQQVCNFCIPVAPAGRVTEMFCGCCRYNTTIPDLTKQGNREKWRRLEAAKRRMFYQLDLLGLPRGKAVDGFNPPLSFEFKEDFTSAGSPEFTGILSDTEVVMTGHLNGKITINTREADPIERERLRVQFGEAHRSLIGHFRHEMGHYYWALLVRGKCEDAFKSAFGDHNNPLYSDALQQYYQQGPPADWAQRYASAYASMHPWEDFAETFAAYLEMVGALDTSAHTGLGASWIPQVSPNTGFDDMISAYAKLGTAMNEMNRTMGLKDLLARPLVAPVIDKMRFVHQLVHDARDGRVHSGIGRPVI